MGTHDGERRRSSTTSTTSTSRRSQSVVMEVVTQWVAPTAGVVIANAMFATPMRAVLQARKQGTLSDLNPVPWAAIVCNCAAWIGYSYFKKDWFVYLANQPGLVMGLFYSLTALGLARTQRTKDSIVLIFTGISVLLPACAAALNLAIYQADDENEEKAVVWGFLCNFILVVYYSAPLSTLLTVVRTKSATTLHFPSCLMNLVNGTCWVAYGFAIKDYFILSPNAAGVVLSVVQIALIAIYRETDEQRLGSWGLSTRSFFFPSKSTLGAGENGHGVNGNGNPLPRSDSSQHLVEKDGDNNSLDTRSSESGDEGKQRV